MRIVVTGASGLTGGEVVRELARRGHEVIGVIRRPVAAGVPGAEVVLADCADGSTMAPLLSRCDAFVHIAGIHLGRALAGVPELRRPGSVVVVSTAGIYSAHRRSAELYGRNEEAVRSARPDAVVLRPTMIYGSEHDRNIHHVIAFARRFRFLPLVGRGEALVQPIHYQDLAEAIVSLVGTAATGTLDAGGAEPLSVRSAALAVLAAVGLPPRVIRIPARLAYVAARAMDVVSLGRWSERVARMSEDRTVDNSRLLAFTGVRPRDFPRGVRDQVLASYGQ